MFTILRKKRNDCGGLTRRPRLQSVDDLLRSFALVVFRDHFCELERPVRVEQPQLSDELFLRKESCQLWSRLEADPRPSIFRSERN